jgi:hypothetical protein
MAGIFISRGMTVAIPEGGFAIGIDPQGSSTANLTLHVHYDVCPTWCELALRHLGDARAARDERVAAWVGTDEDHKARCLEREFEASMQAIMAAAIALDAFYSRNQTYIQLPPLLVQQWRNKRTARYSQITEVLRLGFNLKPKGTAALRQNLKEIYRFRDLAVHPSGKIQAPFLHPEMEVGVEWRFAHFRAQNAELIVNAATGMLRDLANNGKPANNDIRKYMEALRQRLALLFSASHLSTTSAEL